MTEFASFETSVLELNKTIAYQKLNAYYGQSTVFDVLGIERNENRHSAFLAWLFNPVSTHGLKEAPLRKFLSLVAVKASDDYKCYYPQVREHLITGNYSLQVECIKTEQSIIGLASDVDRFKDVVDVGLNGGFKQDANNRFDIWMLLHVKFTDENDNEQQWSLPIVVENKIYSAEGDAQTERYAKALNILKNSVCPNPNYSQPLLVYLAPSDAKKPTSQDFIPLTYQDLLDYVLQPCFILCASQTSSSDARVLIEGYIRNLSCPSNRDGENKKHYSILAIAETESHDLEAIFSSKAFQTSLCAVYPEEAQFLLGTDYQVVEDELPMTELFWNANENLFKIVLYNHFKGDKTKMIIVRKIVRVSNRDNTRYLVGLQKGNWVNKDNRPASKSEASFLIFKAYCEQWHQQQHNGILTVDDLRKEFKVELNSYYHNRFLKYLFYDLKEEVKGDVEGTKFFGKVISPESDTWDFYWDDDHKLPYVKGNVHSVKMWRKDDFDKLLKKAQECGIVVVPA